MNRKSKQRGVDRCEAVSMVMYLADTLASIVESAQQVRKELMRTAARAGLVVRGKPAPRKRRATAS